MARARAIAGGLLAALAVAGAAGCGGDSGVEDGTPAAYVTELDEARRTFAEEVRSINRLDGDDAALAAYTAAAEQAADEVRAIDPPDDIADLHGQLVEGFDAFAGAAADAEAAITSGDVDQVVAAQQQILRAAETHEQLLNDTVAQINAELGATG